MKGLRSAAHFVRGEVGKTVKLRYTPEIEFRLDESIGRGDAMLDLLRSLHIDEAKDDEEEKDGGTDDR